MRLRHSIQGFRAIIYSHLMTVRTLGVSHQTTVFLSFLFIKQSVINASAFAQNLTSLLNYDYIYFCYIHLPTENF